MTNFITVTDDYNNYKKINPLFITSIDERKILGELTQIITLHGTDKKYYYTGSYAELVKESKGE